MTSLGTSRTSLVRELLRRAAGFARNDQVASRPLFYLVFTLLVVAVAFAGLNGSLQNADESTFAFMSREMLQRGSWIVQYEFGEPTMLKSPMVFWTTMASFKVFGISDFTARIPVALANIGAAFALFFIARRLFGSYKTALMSVLIYQVSLQVNANAHQLCTDVYYQTFLLLGLLFIIKALQEDRRWFLLVGFSNAMVFLSKSALGLILPAFLLLYILVERRWRLLWWLAAVFALSLVISFPYFFATYQKVPEVFKREFLGDYLAGAAVGEESRNVLFILYGFVYFFVLLVIMMLPYSSSLAFVLFRRREPGRPGQIVWQGECKLLSLMFLVSYVGFSVIERRLPHYTLPMIPALAVFIAFAFRDPDAHAGLADTSGADRSRKYYLAHAALAGTALALFSLFVITQGHRYKPFLDVAIGLMVIYVVFVGMNLLFFLKRVPGRVGLFTVTVVFFLAFTLNAWITVPLDFNQDIKSFAPVYQGPAPVYVIGSKQANEGRKKRVIYWYFDTANTAQYGSLSSFTDQVGDPPDGSYMLFYHGYTSELEKRYPSLQVLDTGIVWNIGVIR